MRRSKLKRLVFFKLLRRLPGFPFVPVLPAAMLISAFTTSLQALFRVRRLERRAAETAA